MPTGKAIDKLSIVRRIDWLKLEESARKIGAFFKALGALVLKGEQRYYAFIRTHMYFPIHLFYTFACCIFCLASRVVPICHQGSGGYFFFACEYICLHAHFILHADMNFLRFINTNPSKIASTYHSENGLGSIHRALKVFEDHFHDKNKENRYVYVHLHLYLHIHACAYRYN